MSKIPHGEPYAGRLYVWFDEPSDMCVTGLFESCDVREPFGGGWMRLCTGGSMVEPKIQGTKDHD